MSLDAPVGLAEPDPERLKSLLVHEDEMVREAICFYFFESFSDDTELIPLVLEACRRYGIAQNEASLGFAGRFVIDRDSISLVLDRLRQSDDPLLVYLFSDWIARAPLPSIDRLGALERYVSRLWPQSVARISRRRILRELPPSALWQSLYELDALPAAVPGVEIADKAEELLEALAAQEGQGVLALEVLARMNGDTSIPPARRRHGARLAGLARVGAAVPYLVTMLEESATNASLAAESLVRIREPSTLAAIGEVFLDRSPSFATRSASVLSGLKIPQAEKTILDLLEAAEEPYQKGPLLNALRFHPSPRSLARLRTAVREGAGGRLARELKKAVSVMSLVLRARPDEEMRRWKAELEAAGDTNIRFFLDAPRH